MRIKSINKVGVEPVYDLYVEKQHNFVSNGGVILHNCDALRYWCVMHTLTAKEIDTRSPEEKALADYKASRFRSAGARSRVIR